MPPRIPLPAAFLAAPIAHRALHDRRAGRIENSPAAIRAALDHGYAIEIDLQLSQDGIPMVFHDDELDRLTTETGPVSARLAAELHAIRLKYSTDTIPTLAQVLEMVSGRVPLLVEIKSDWSPPRLKFLQTIAEIAKGYKGPIALMSFNMDVVVALGRLAPRVPRGLVLGRHQVLKSWLARAGRAAEGTALSRILEGALDKVSFFAVDVNILKGAAAWRKQAGHDIPLFSWTIRTKRQRTTAARYADAPIFEGYHA